MPNLTQCLEGTRSKELVPLISFLFQEHIGNEVLFCVKEHHWNFIPFHEEHERFFRSFFKKYNLKF